MTERVELAEGRAVLHLGDCLSLLSQLPPGSISAVITDPPYGMDLTDHHFGKADRRMRIAGDDSQDAGNAVIGWAFENKLTVAAFARPELPWQGDGWQWLVWDKGGAVGGGGCTKTSWKRTWELIQVANVKRLLLSRDSAVLRHTLLPADYQHHRCQKPVSLMAYLIRQLVPPGGTVFDPFMGSGSTGTAAVSTGRRFIGCEIQPDYFETARKRIEGVTSDGPLFAQQTATLEG